MSRVYPIEELTAYFRKANAEKKTVIALAYKDTKPGQAGSCFPPVKLIQEDGKEIDFPNFHQTFVTSSKLQPRRDNKGNIQSAGYAQVSASEITADILTETAWKPATFPKLVAQTNALIEFADELDKQYELLFSTTLDGNKHVRIGIENKNVTITKTERKPFMQRSRKPKDGDDLNKLNAAGQIPLDKPLVRFTAKFDKKHNRFGYAPKDPKNKDRELEYRYMFQMKVNGTTNKTVPLRIPDATGKPQDLNLENCDKAVTYRSIMVVEGSSEVVFSGQGISTRLIIKSAVVHPHKVMERERFSTDELDLDQYGEAALPVYASETKANPLPALAAGEVPLDLNAPNVEEPETNLIDAPDEKKDDVEEPTDEQPEEQPEDQPEDQPEEPEEVAPAPVVVAPAPVVVASAPKKPVARPKRPVT